MYFTSYWYIPNSGTKI